MIDIQISDKPLDQLKGQEMGLDAGSGGVVDFIGTVRNATQNKTVLHLDFEAYIPMAIKEMTKIAESIQTKWPVKSVIIHHRIGQLIVGEVAVFIRVSSAHRKEAFEACQFAIDTLKETVPIWKKEVFEDGEVWVSAHP